MKNISRLRSIAIIVILAASMAMSVIFGLVSAKATLRDNNEKDCRMTAALVSNAIDNSFLRPMTVSETMSKDASLRDYLKKSGASAESVEAEIADYLDSIRNGFGYVMVFAVCEKSKAYYTYNGISKFVDPENDPHDTWYKLFVESGKSCNLDVDTEEAANWTLSVFVNDAVYDENNEFLGICGVGVEMTQLQLFLERYERIYDINIDLIDHTGLVQVDTDGEQIERDYIKVENLSAMTDGEYYYEILDSGNRVITYMENLDWFLVVTDNAAESKGLLATAKPFLDCTAAAAVLVLAVVIGTMWYEKAHKCSEKND